MPASVLIDRHSPLAAVAAGPNQHESMAADAVCCSLDSTTAAAIIHNSRSGAVTQPSSNKNNAYLAIDLAKLAANLSFVESSTAGVSQSSTSMGSVDVSVSSPSFGRSACTSSSSGTGVNVIDGQQQPPSPVFNPASRKSANMTECVPVPSSEHVAEIVGRQGSKIKALRAKTNTYIKTPVRGEEPVFVVTGRREDVAAAKREILSASEHFSQIRASRLSAGSTGGSSPGSSGRPCPQNGGTDMSGHVTIHVRVPYRVVGLVVGPKGATIKRIQQDSGTYIVTPSRDREPVFEVTGSCDGVEKARRDIESYIALRTGALPDATTGGGSTINTMQSLCGGSETHDLDPRILLGSLLKTGTSQMGPNTTLMSYNNAINLGSTHFLPTDINTNGGGPLKLSPMGNGGGYPGCDNGNNLFGGMHDRYNNGALTAFSKSILSPSVLNNNNNNMLGSVDTWSNNGGCADLVGANLRSLASLFPLGDDYSNGFNSVAGSNGGLKCSGRMMDDPMCMTPLDALVASYANFTPSALECCVTCPQYGGQTLIDNGIVIGSGFNGSGRSASDSSPSVSPTDSNMSPRRLCGTCCLCSEGVIAAALVPCGHNLFCKTCADAIVTRPDPEERRCPACGETASLAIRILS